jgi:hypothetical protein
MCKIDILVRCWIWGFQTRNYEYFFCNMARYILVEIRLHFGETYQLPCVRLFVIFFTPYSKMSGQRLKVGNDRFHQYRRFEIFTAVVMKISVFQDIRRCSQPTFLNLRQADSSSCYILPADFLFGLNFDPEDGSSTFLRNVSGITDYTALHPRI